MNEYIRRRKVEKEVSAEELEIANIKHWFAKDYLVKIAEIKRHKYLGLPNEVTEYEVEREAYNKEQRLRELEHKEPLPEISIIDIL